MLCILMLVGVFNLLWDLLIRFTFRFICWLRVGWILGLVFACSVACGFCDFGVF